MGFLLLGNRITSIEEQSTTTPALVQEVTYRRRGYLTGERITPEREDRSHRVRERVEKVSLPSLITGEDDGTPVQGIVTGIATLVGVVVLEKLVGNLLQQVKKDPKTEFVFTSY